MTWDPSYRPPRSCLSLDVVKGKFAQSALRLDTRLVFTQHKKRTAQIRHTHDELDGGSELELVRRFVEMLTQVVEQQLGRAVRAGGPCGHQPDSVSSTHR